MNFIIPTSDYLALDYPWRNACGTCSAKSWTFQIVIVYVSERLCICHGSGIARL
ncbi:hypothetical protein J6590_026558 [Homalodisca vitripennis]|nr:hypothetical protein J6590_026558 [Homalodisca vitripennis]